MSGLPEPQSRQDKFLHNIADGTPSIDDVEVISREDQYLSYIATNGVPLKDIPLTVDKGGTGATTDSGARTNLSVYSKSETDTLLSAKANTNSLSTVATSGSYNDLTNTPTIPSGTDLVPSGGTDGQVLTKVSGVPAWANAASGVTDFTKCYTGTSSNPTTSFTDVRDISRAISNTLGTGINDMVLVYIVLQSTSIVANESLFYLAGLVAEGNNTVDIIGCPEQYDISKTTYLVIGGRIGGAYLGTQAGSVNQVALLNTTNSTITIAQISGYFEVYAKKIGGGL